MIAAFRRFAHWYEQPTPVAPALFDDGLVEIARLIAVGDPVKAGSVQLPGDGVGPCVKL
jgi:hypothetical protein